MGHSPAGVRTVLFTDIVGHSEMMERLGDASGRDILREHERITRKILTEHGGAEVKTMGDGFLASFMSVTRAVECAIALQKGFAEYTEAADELLYVRVGLNSGEPVEEEGDLFGVTVILASRICSQAAAEEIFIPETVRGLLSGKGFLLVERGEFTPKGLSDSVRLYEVDWRGSGSQRERHVKRATGSPGNLPAATSSFVGRANELVAVRQVLASARLVTLTGVGGVGKTRLAIQLGAELAINYPDGVWLVELASLGDDAALVHAVAGVFGIGQQPGRTVEQSVTDSLVGRRLLVVLDNCEHLIESAARLAEQILARCPGVTLLATSREALMVEGEQIWPVPSLAFAEGASSPAFTLFVDRARAIVPQFEAGQGAAAIIEICRRLDGIPLAIELAAARVRSLGVAQIRDRLNERFTLLTGGSRRALERHQTLRHAVQWSYDLLSESERLVLSRASVFAGGFTLEAAEQICSGGIVAPADVMDLLDSLVRKSLVNVEHVESGARYAQLETIRQFGGEQLAEFGESNAARNRHAEFFAGESTAMFDVWLSPRQLVAYQWLDREIDNLGSAFHWSADAGDTEVAITIAANIGDLARMRLRYEAFDWAAQMAEAARSVRHRRLAVLLSWASSNAWAVGAFEEARLYGEDAISLRDDPNFDPFVWAFTDLAMVALYEGDVDRALELAEAGAAHPADSHDRFCMAVHPFVMVQVGKHVEALNLVNACAAMVEEAGIPVSIAILYLAKGLALSQSNAAEAIEALDFALAIARRSGNRLFETFILPEVASLHGSTGDEIGALHSFSETLATWQTTADRFFVAPTFSGLVVLFERLGLHEGAAILYGTLAREFESTSFERSRDAVSRVKATLGDLKFEEFQRRGAELTLHEAAEFAQKQILETLQDLNDRTFANE